VTDYQAYIKTSQLKCYVTFCKNSNSLRKAVNKWGNKFMRCDCQPQSPSAKNLARVVLVRTRVVGIPETRRAVKPRGHLGQVIQRPDLVPFGFVTDSVSSCPPMFNSSSISIKFISDPCSLVKNPGLR